LQRNAKLRQKDSKFIKLQAGEKKILQFNAEKIEQIEAEFDGRKTQRYQYAVTKSNNRHSDNHIDSN
jgi:hypothetical protein